MSTLCDLWRETLRRFPGNVALHHRDHDWTYAQIDDRAQRLANWLVAHGFQPGDRVVLLVPNSLEYVVGYIAALLAGGVAVGLNPEAMPREQAHFIDHCAAHAVIASPS
ncbi:MAG: long-chain fatty acid--CoA ligase, partial [Planctomycetaceae bacterium]